MQSSAQFVNSHDHFKLVGKCVKKKQCCGGALAFYEPRKSRQIIRESTEYVHDHGVEILVTPRLLCQANIKIDEDQINPKFGSNFEMPVVYYSQLVSVVCVRDVEDSASDSKLIKAKQLEEIAAK